MTIRLKRAYEPPTDTDGFRILVVRLWPRGLSKEAIRHYAWTKEVAPSNELRKWYSHDPDDWPEFKRRYYTELDRKGDEVKIFTAMIEGKNVTLVYSSRARLNNALALKEYFESRYPELLLKTCSAESDKG